MVEQAVCTGCGACSAVCEVEAVRMRPDREGFLYPEMDPARCTGCGKCGAVCPVSRTEGKTGARRCFGAQASEEAARKLGSSGGVFPLMASRILAQGGAVFGAALLEDGSVRHVCVRRQEDLPRITRTKYVQSNLAQVWEQLRALRKEGPVLFCGTPCQTDAVRLWLGEDRVGVILADLVCYGVPSPGIWSRYVRYLEKKHQGTFQSFSFRDKREEHGRACALRIGGRELVRPLWEDPFLRTYFKNVNLRPACFRCGYTTVERSSDVTLGDFWGVERVQPGFDDGTGCSVVLCHTQAGMDLWEQVRDQTRWFACQEAEAANEEQPRLSTPTRPSPRRALWMGLYGRIPFPLWLRLAGR